VATSVAIRGLSSFVRTISRSGPLERLRRALPHIWGRSEAATLLRGENEVCRLNYCGLTSA
jgi:hypothetical protein